MTERSNEKFLWLAVGIVATGLLAAVAIILPGARRTYPEAEITENNQENTKDGTKIPEKEINIEGSISNTSTKSVFDPADLNLDDFQVNFTPEQKTPQFDAGKTGGSYTEAESKRRNSEGKSSYQER